MYNFVFYNHTLWTFEGLVNHTFSTVLIDSTIFPSTVILYLSHFPKKLWESILYVLIWILPYSLWESISGKLGLYKYEHGWNLMWSISFNVLLFTMVRFHYKKPLLAWPISFALFGIYMYIFKIPFSAIK